MTSSGLPVRRVKRGARLCCVKPITPARPVLSLLTCRDPEQNQRLRNAIAATLRGQGSGDDGSAALASAKLRSQWEKLPRADQKLSVDVTNVLRAGYRRRQELAFHRSKMATGEIGASEASAMLPPSELLPPLH